MMRRLVAGVASASACKSRACLASRPTIVVVVVVVVVVVIVVVVVEVKTSSDRGLVRVRVLKYLKRPHRALRIGVVGDQATRVGRLLSEVD